MTFVGQVDNRRSRCRQQLARMSLLAPDHDAMARPPRVAADVREVTNAIIAEMEAACRAVIGNARYEPGAETFLWVRVARLAATADRAVSAARRGDVAELRGHLRHFETLALAVWTVQDAI